MMQTPWEIEREENDKLRIELTLAREQLAHFTKECVTCTPLAAQLVPRLTLPRSSPNPPTLRSEIDSNASDSGSEAAVVKAKAVA